MLIDTNIFLEFLLEQEKAEKAFLFVSSVSSKEKSRAYISDFNVDSILIAMAHNNSKIEKMKEFLNNIINSEGLIVYDITIGDRLKAVKFMEKYKLDYEDALTLQAAISTKSEEIVSFDKHFDNIKEIKRIEP
ncbi:MAG: type II toxin-antitoxin system VapC family toxin [Nanoarchaeota archaeon]